MGAGKRIKEELDKQDRSVTWLSRNAQIPPTTLYSIINRDTLPNATILFEIAQTLDVPIDKLLIDYDRTTKNKILDFLKKLAISAGINEVYNSGTEDELLFFFRLLNPAGQIAVVENAKSYSRMKKYTKEEE